MARPEFGLHVRVGGKAGGPEPRSTLVLFRSSIQATTGSDRALNTHNFLKCFQDWQAGKLHRRFLLR
jgi:hypothetical protein